MNVKGEVLRALETDMRFLCAMVVVVVKRKTVVERNVRCWGITTENSKLY